MIVYVSVFITLLILYYSRLRYVVHRLILLEFISFYILSLIGVTGGISLLGQFIFMVIFLVFVLEGVIGIIRLVLFTNYSGSGIIGLSRLKYPW